MFFGLFKKKIRVKEGDLLNASCFLFPKRKTRKLNINTELILPNECRCVFAHKGDVYEVFSNAGEYELNGNSLPKLFKAGRFNKPNRKGKISPYFNCLACTLHAYTIFLSTTDFDI